MEKTAERDVKVYEIGYLIVPSIPEEKVAGQTTAIKDILAKYKAEVIADEPARLRPLAYTMVKKIGTANRRFDSAYFGWVKFESTTADVKSIEKEVKEVESVLRFLLINTVREHTLLSSKLMEDKKPAENAAKEPVSIEDMDKSIDKTVSDLSVA